MDENERQITCVIPENFVDTGRCFNGKFRTRNLIEGLVLSLPIALVINYVADQINLSLENKIVLIVIIAGGILLLSIIGINGDSLTEFLENYIRFYKLKRIAKYNPRVKTEAFPGYLTKDLYELPRDKIIRIYNDFLKRNVETAENSISQDIYDPMYIEFFEDDLGFVATPEDLKTAKEKRADAKAKKNAAKKIKKDQKDKDKQIKRQAKIEAKIKEKEDKKNAKK